MHDGYTLLSIVDFVDDAIVANANTPALATGKFPGSKWAWFLSKRADRVAGGCIWLRRELGEFALGAAKNGDIVRHSGFCLRSISSIASSNGIASSSAAFAAS